MLISPGQTLPGSADVMATSEKVASYFIDRYPDVGADSYVGGKKRNSKIWTRGVFYEGLLNIYREKQKPEWLKYSIDWGEFHKWKSSSDTEAKRHNADYQCCGQAYLQMYLMGPSQTVRMEHIKMRIDQMIASERINYWTWVDAIQMSMPVFPYRDLVEPDKDCYWSRGNGWVYMALTRILQFTSENESHRQDYIADFKMMSEGLKNCQRADGSWNVSLAAPLNFGPSGSEGPEMTGTSLFIGGMAYGVRTGMLDASTYLPVICKGWEAMRSAVHESTGQVGYLQGTGSAPEHGNPITFDAIPDFEDFGYGCWLWGAAEVHALLRQLEGESSITDPEITASDNGDAPCYDLLGRKVVNPCKGHVYIHNHRLEIIR